MRSVVGLSVAVAVLIAIVSVQSAQAHTELVGSEPAANTVVRASPERLQLLFSEPVESRFRTVRIYDANASRVDRGPARLSPIDPRILESDLRDLTTGSYVVVWRVLSVDGHVARGSFSFGVGAGAQPSIGGAFAPREEGVPVVVEVLVRWGLYLGLLLLVGSFAFRPLVLLPALLGRESSEVDTTRFRPGYSLVLLGLALALTCHVAGLILQVASVAELPMGAVLRGEAIFDVLTSTRYGLAWMVRSALLLTLIVVALRLRAPGASMAHWWLGAATGSLGLLTLSAAGHASALAPDQAPVAILLDWIHLTSAGVWLGGLAQLALALRGPTSLVSTHSLIARFTPVAAVGIGILLLTGAYAALQHVPTWQAFVDTTYGAALSGKLFLVAPLLAIGALNLALFRAFPSSSPLVATLLLGELALGVAVVGITAVLTGQPPATGLVRGQPFRTVQPGPVMDVELFVTPNQAGENRLEVGIQPHPDQPFVPQRVEIQLTMTGMEMEPRELVTNQIRPGRYEVTGDFLSMAGPWSADVRVVGSAPQPATPSNAGQIARFDFTVGQPPGANHPALSPARLLLKAAVVSTPDGAARLTWSFGGALLALTLGIALLAGRITLAGRVPGIGQTSMLLTSLCLCALGVGLGSVALADGYRRDLPMGSSVPIEARARDEGSIARGREVYARCVACHGIGGRGDGPAGQALQPPPSDFRVRMAAGNSDQQVYDQIARGIPGSSMPAFADQLSRRQILDVINYVRAFADIER